MGHIGSNTYAHGYGETPQEGILTMSILYSYLLNIVDGKSPERTTIPQI